jgi:hypothetical protein
VKSIGIITIQNSQNNYGGVLQCFALYEYLRQSGYDCEVIDLHRPNQADFIDSIKFRPMRQSYGWKAMIKGSIYEMLGIRKLRNPNFHPTWNAEAGKKFDLFNTQVRLSIPYTYIPDLYKNPPQYDIYISGSDQLWNPEQPYCLEPYFLTFVKNKKALKISYATSIGVTELQDNEKNKFRKWLSSYDAISVREPIACKMLKEITQREIERVPDPTFLLSPDMWINMATTPIVSSPYILVFSLFQEKSLLQKAVELAQEANMKVVVIDQNYLNSPHDSIIVVDNAGPCDFIGLIRQAALVLTDSFHCSVFSIITGTRNFYTYIAPNNQRGSRIIDLLKLYNLSDHLLSDIANLISYKSIENIKIDIQHTHYIMQQEQTIGRDFLNKSIHIQK